MNKEIKVGSIVNMVDAGGWGYSPDNNHCLALVTSVDDSFGDIVISGSIINPNVLSYVNFHNIPVKEGDKIVIRLATEEELMDIEELKIGYKVINPKYLNYILIRENRKYVKEGDIISDPESIGVLKDACILDSFTLPEYEFSPLPVINGYKGKIRGSKIVYGCAELPLSWFKSSANRSITTMVLSSGVTITSEEISKISNYIKGFPLKS
jgi:hypothetical protein